MKCVEVSFHASVEMIIIVMLDEPAALAWICPPGGVRCTLIVFLPLEQAVCE